MNYNELDIEISDKDSFLKEIRDKKNFTGYNGPKNIAVDIGAHIGTRSLFLATEVDFDKIYAIEMHPGHYLMLCRNINKNGLQDKIIPICAAISDKSEIKKIYKDDSHNTGQQSIFFKDDKNSDNYHICTISLYDLIEQIGEIDFLKIDTEGAEYRIFNNDKITEALSHVRHIYMELHGPSKAFFDDSFFSDMGYDPVNPNAKIIEILNNCGFTDAQQGRFKISSYNHNITG